MMPDKNKGSMKEEAAAGTTISRRSFIKAMGLGAVGLALPGPVSAAGSSGEELATLLDIGKCVGCEACVDACREANHEKYPKPEKPFPRMYPAHVKPSDWSDRQDERDRLTPYNWLYVQTAAVEHNGRKELVNIPRRCMHCQNPPCANLCPWGAAYKQHNGIVRIDSEICLGGAKCRTVCPWEIPQRQTGVGLYLKLLPSVAGNGVMYKCDRCYDRIARGMLPACVEACPEEVQSIGPRSLIVAKARELAAGMNGYIYGLEENGGANTIYVSPVPFEKLDAALKEVKEDAGRPHLNPVAPVMAKEDKLAWSVFLAPFAGVAAGVLRARNMLASSRKTAEDARDAKDVSEARDVRDVRGAKEVKGAREEGK